MDHATGSAVVATMGHRFPDAALEQDALRGTGIQVLNLGALSKEAAVEAAADAEGILLGLGFSLDAKALARLRRCKVIVRYGVGVDNVDVSAALAQGITVSNVPDYGIEEVANHTLALLLLFARRLDLWANALHNGQWGAALPKISLPRLSETTLGIVGLGRIGRAVLARALPLWGRILVYDPWVSDAQVQELGGIKTSLEDLLSESDFLTLHVPSTAETRQLLTAERLAIMKKGAVLINCSRGDVIDEVALVRRISEGHLTGAGLDVFATEPPPLDGIVSLPGVLATPHVAYVSTSAIRDLRRKAAKEAGHVLLGHPPQYAVIPANR